MDGHDEDIKELLELKELLETRQSNGYLLTITLYIFFGGQAVFRSSC